MKKKHALLLCIISALVLWSGCTTMPWLDRDSADRVPETGTKALALLVETDWLAAQSDTDNLRIIDCRDTIETYQTGHIPGAVFLSRKVVWDTVEGIKGMLPETQKVASAFEQVGVSNQSTVILYDAKGGLWASRFFWALEYLGHKNVHILNGGWLKWVGEGRPTQVETPSVSKGTFKVAVQSAYLVNKGWMLAHLSDPEVKIIDTRSPNEYHGKDVRAQRGGHIPGAVHIDWVHNLAQTKAKTFKSESELAALYTGAKISPGKTIVTHCQTGVRGAHTYFALRLLGYEKVAVYDGSWAEWGNDRQTPIVR
jgi:thiosulfate/3-mercaptopyruvate sulfurtransferase